MITIFTIYIIYDIHKFHLFISLTNFKNFNLTFDTLQVHRARQQQGLLPNPDFSKDPGQLCDNHFREC